MAPHAAATATAAAAASGSASLLQLAAWRRANPAERGRGQRVHPVIDALAAALTASAALEDSLLCALCCVTSSALGPAEDSSDKAEVAVAAAAAAQDWRLRLEAVAASTSGLSLCFTQDGIPPDGAALEAVTVAYMLARKATAAAATAAAAANAGNVSAGDAATPARAWETWWGGY